MYYRAFRQSILFTLNWTSVLLYAAVTLPTVDLPAMHLLLHRLLVSLLKSLSIPLKMIQFDSEERGKNGPSTFHNSSPLLSSPLLSSPLLSSPLRLLALEMEVLSALADYIYSSRFTIPHPNMESLLKGADLLQCGG